MNFRLSGCTKSHAKHLVASERFKHKKKHLYEVSNQLQLILAHKVAMPITVNLRKFAYFQSVSEIELCVCA